MKREVPKVHTSTVEVEGEGVCIRFCPLETALSEYTEPACLMWGIAGSSLGHRAFCRIVWAFEAVQRFFVSFIVCIAVISTVPIDLYKNERASHMCPVGVAHTYVLT